MPEFCIEVASHVFSIKTMYSFTEKYCKGYITDKKPEYTVCITEKDIAAERENTYKQLKKEGLPVTDYPEQNYEYTAVYRKIADILIDKNIFLFHGALIEKDNKGYLFTAKSGTGKTTHILNWKKQYPDCRIINGDKPLIKYENGNYFAYGTPWAGKEHYQINESVKLNNIILLCRGKENSVEKISLTEALPTLLVQSYLLLDGTALTKVTDLFCNMYGKVNFYRLYCNTDVSSAKIAYESINGL